MARVDTRLELHLRLTAFFKKRGKKQFSLVDKINRTNKAIWKTWEVRQEKSWQNRDFRKYLANYLSLEKSKFN